MSGLSAFRLGLIAGAHLLNFAIVLLWPNLVCSYVATGLFALVLILLFRLDSIAMWLLLPFVIAQVSVMVSLNVIEAGSYMVEMGEAGHPSTAAASFGLYSTVLLLTSVLTLRRLRRPAEREGGLAADPAAGAHVLFQWAMVCVALLSVGYLLLAGLRTGFPLLSGMDRFVYRRLYADILTVNILDLKITPPIVLGALAAFADRSSIRRLGFAAFIALLGLSFLYGEKFFIILVSVGSFIVPFIIRNPQSTARLLGRLAPLIAVAVGCVAAVTFLIYSDYGARGTEATLARLGDRVGGQGQLWFVAVEHASRWIHLDTDLLYQNLANLVAPNPQDYAFEHHLAVLHFIYHYSPPAMFRSFQHNAGFVTATMGFEAYGLVMFGYVGLLVQMILTGIFLGWLLGYLHRAIAQGAIFTVLLPAFLLTQTVKLLSQGTLYILLSLSVCKAYAAFLILQFLVSAASNGLDPLRRLRALQAAREAAAKHVPSSPAPANPQWPRPVLEYSAPRPTPPP